jgi:hypothetical protein
MLLFQSADNDGNGMNNASCCPHAPGSLDPEEFLSILQSKTLGLHLTSEQLEEVRKLADKDDDGCHFLSSFGLTFVRRHHSR